MFLLVAVIAGASPTFEVTNKCPPAFAVTNRCPPPAAKPVKVTNGFNCGAGFCGANGGKGCPSCPNGNGTCACGPQAAPVAFTIPAATSSCPSGNCPQAAPAYQPLWRFRR